MRIRDWSSDVCSSDPLADAHLAALEHAVRAAGCEEINVGTGQGITVKELIAAYERACGHSLANEIVERRAGDVESSYAANGKARSEERRVGKECVSTSRSRGWAYH